MHTFGDLLEGQAGSAQSQTMAKKVAVTARTHSQCEGRWHRWRLEAPPCSLPTQLSLWKVPRVCLPNSEKRVLLSPVFLLRGAHLKLSLGFLLGSCRHFLPNSPYWKSPSEKQVFAVSQLFVYTHGPGTAEQPCQVRNSAHGHRAASASCAPRCQSGASLASRPF